MATMLSGGAGGMSASGGSSGIGDSTSGSGSGNISFGAFAPGGNSVPMWVWIAAGVVVLWVMKKK